MLEFWPSSLAEELARRSVIVVLGAGVSKTSLSRDGARQPPLWQEFLEEGLHRCGKNGTRHIRQAIRKGDYLHAAEWIKGALGDGWNEFLTDTFLAPEYQSSDLHDVIFRLDQRIVFSLNIDSIYDTYVGTQTSGRTIVKNYFEEDIHNFLRDRHDYIIKIHGSVSSPDKIVMTQQEYSAARPRYSGFYTVLDASILSHTLLFVGCGVADPDLNLLLENQNFRFPFARPHYLVTSSKTSKYLEASLKENRNLRCLKYDERDDHSDLLVKLRELLEETEREKATLK